MNIPKPTLSFSFSLKRAFFAILFLAAPICLNAQIITTYAGTTGGFSGDGGPATLAQFNRPWGVTINHTTGDIYFCDFNNCRVRKIHMATGIISTFAGTGVVGYSGDGGPATLAKLNFPTGIEIDNVGNVYISDIYNHRIRKVDLAGIITTYAGNGIAAATGDGGPSALASIGNPNGLGMDAANNLYIPDYIPQTVRKVTSGSTIINTIAGTPGIAGYSGDGGPALGATMNLVNDVAVDASNNVYISDWNNNVIRKINTSGIISTFCGIGAPGFSGDGGPANMAAVRGPAGFYFHCDNNMFICDVDNHRIRMISPSGIITTVAGNGTAGLSGDGGPATAGSLNRPVKVVLDAIGNLYTSDINNNRIRKISIGKVVCVGNTIPFCDRTGTGTWASSNMSVATVASTGVVSGISPGTSTITLSLPSGYYVTGTVTVNPSAGSSLGGTMTLCAGSTTTLTATGGGTWSIAPATVATISATGVVSGISPGTATVSYTTALCGAVTAVVTVTAAPPAITGNAPLCPGSTITLSNPMPGGIWSCAPTTVATVGPSGIVTGVSIGTATVSYTTACGSVSVVVTVNSSSATIIGNIPICVGTSVALGGIPSGGTWSCSPATVATISGSGILSGVATGTAMVTYTTACGSTTVVATVNSTTAPITGSMPFCMGTTITLHNAIGGGTWTCIPSSVATINSTGVVTGVSGGTATVTYTTPCGISTTIVTVKSSPVVAASADTVCEGDALHLSSGSATVGSTFYWTGPGGFTSTLANPTISPASPIHAGVYHLTITYAGCTSAPFALTVIVNPRPVITGMIATNPGTCIAADGSILFKGLNPLGNYTVNYLFNGLPQSTTLVADATGNLLLSGLSIGIYSNITITSSSGCISNIFGPVELSHPLPPAPVIHSNSPLCEGTTLKLTATNTVTGGTYSWSYPDGGGSILQNPQRLNVMPSASGLYTVTHTINDCSNSATTKVAIYPLITLLNVTHNQTVAYGKEVQLNAEGAVFYRWTPAVTLNNPNINNPLATPTEKTMYTIYGMNEGGCIDSAKVIIDVDDDVDPYIPTGFTPNGDGLNDVFRIKGMNGQKLVDFSVYNRWGQLVYHNEYKKEEGWDGSFNGTPQEMGVYNYSIIIGRRDGTNRMYKGDVTLVR